MKKIFDILIIILATCHVFASEKCVKGVYYDFDAATQQATVTYRGKTYQEYRDEYHGRLILPSVVLYNGMVYAVTSISESAFRDCRCLREVVIPKSITRIGMFAFKGTALEKDMSYWDKGIMYVNQCAVDAKYDELVGDVTLRSDTRLIADYAFAECDGMTGLNMSDNVLSVGKMAFALCTGLEHIRISKRVRTISEMTFWACIFLKKIDLPSEVELIEQGAFGGCIRLETISLDSANTKYKVTNGVLFTGDMTTLVCYPAGLKNDKYQVPDGVRQIGAWAFEAANKLTEISLPERMKYILPEAFIGCETLSRINIPETVDIIGENAFARCFELHQLHIPQHTFVAKTIGEPDMVVYREQESETENTTESENTKLN